MATPSKTLAWYRLDGEEDDVLGYRGMLDLRKSDQVPDFGVPISELRVYGFGFGFRVSGLGFRVSGLRFRGFEVWGLSLRVWGLGFGF